ncbi:hypothetical protein BDB01DRAFT_738514 [Pilobolus umbonatus]|nr:hypothetical protein BDB01DRAFT_738514 [Pilobolus umbonatus]
MNEVHISHSKSCLLTSEMHIHEPQAEDILSDQDLLDLFRLLQQVLRKKPDGDKMAKLLYCISYALGNQIAVYKPLHEDRIIFKDKNNYSHSVRLVGSTCCSPLDMSEERTSFINHDSTGRSDKDTIQKWIDSSSTHPTQHSFRTRLPSVSYITNHISTNSDISSQTITPPISISDLPHEHLTDNCSIRQDTHYRSFYASHPIHPAISSSLITQSPPFSLSANTQLQQVVDTTLDDTHLSLPLHEYNRHMHIKCSDQLQNMTHSIHSDNDMIEQKHQRDLYCYSDRIHRESLLLQQYPEHETMGEHSYKRKRHSPDVRIPAPAKKPKIPHRHGGFESRRDDIINRMRNITMMDLKEKAQMLPSNFTLAIDQSCVRQERSLIMSVSSNTLSRQELGELLQPALQILIQYSNMKPHLDNGMNQNGIHYNSDYFRLYMAFEQFQHIFAIIFPYEVCDMMEDVSNRDRERNVNMKVYRPWIEPLLIGSNWATFRRNIVVGERMMQLSKSVGQGILLMTKELSGSKLHLTFTNNEWDEFISGLISGKWDMCYDNGKSHPAMTIGSVLVSELKLKFNTSYWFSHSGSLLPPNDRYMIMDYTSKIIKYK